MDDGTEQMVDFGFVGDVDYADGDRLASLLKPGGTLTVAHGMSREKLEEHHSGSAHAVSHHLMPAEQLAEIFGEVLRVTAVVDSETMYQVAGTASPSPSDTASSASE